MRNVIFGVRGGLRGRMSAALVVAWAMAALTIGSVAQNAPAAATTLVAPASFSGCVQRAPDEKDALLMDTASVCARLSGSRFSAAKVVGHEVELKGVLTEATPAAPGSIRVETVVSVGKACTVVCTPQPPGTRGVKKKGETPGREGGTPGAAPTTPPQ